MRITYQTFLEPIYSKDSLENDTVTFLELEKEISTTTKFKFKVRENNIYFAQENDKCDIEKAINLQDRGLNSNEYNEVRYKLKKTLVIKPEHHQCITVFEDINEVVFFTFRDNMFNIVTVDTFQDRSIVKSIEKDLYYLIIKNEFKISPVNYTTISPSKIVKLHTGFYSLKTKRKGIEPALMGTLKDTAYTPSPSKISSDYIIQIDKRPLYEYNTQESEYVLIEPSNDFQSFERFNEEDLKDNILIVYTYIDSEVVFEKIILDSNMNSFKFQNTSSEDLFKIDDEFKKNYLFKLYRTPVSIGSNTMDLFSQQILQDIEQNKNIYAKKVHIVDGI